MCVIEYFRTDGSRLEEAAAAATTSKVEYLGRHATVMDAELLGICLALESGNNKIALDSQAAMTRATLLYTAGEVMDRAKVAKSLSDNEYGLMGERSLRNRGKRALADRRANTMAYGGRVMGLADIMTPAGIRQDFP